MRPKAHLLLPAVILAFVCLPTPACSHDDQPEGDGDVDWSSFQPIEMQGLGSSSLEELQETAGFNVILPTYLPIGMSKTFLLSSQDARIEHGAAFVGLAPKPGSDAPTIQIDESIRDPSEPEPRYSSGFEVFRIDQTDIGCAVHIVGNDELAAVGAYTPSPGLPTRDPGLYPTFACEWVNEKLRFVVQFAWKLPEPVPGDITPEMRDEAMKVIASMIEDPYIP